MSRWVTHSQQRTALTNGDTSAAFVLNGESATRLVSPGSYTTSRMRFHVSSFAGNTQTMTLLVNDTQVNQNITVTGTGTFVDTTNTDDVTQGQHILADNNGGAGMHGDNITTEAGQLCFDNASDIGPFLVSASGSTNVFYDFVGAAGNATEAVAAYVFRSARVLSNLTLYILSHSVNGTVRMRKNEADGSQTITVTGTGSFSDTTNSDSYAIGDNGTLEKESGTFNFRGIGLQGNIESSALGGADSLDSAVNLHPQSGHTTATEAYAETYVPADALFHELTANVTGYSATRTLRFRDGGVNGNMNVVCSANGRFTDTTNTDSLTAGDRWNVQLSATGGGFRHWHVEYFEGPAAGGSRPPRGNRSRDNLIRR